MFLIIFFLSILSVVIDEEKAMEVLHNITEQRLLKEIQDGGIPPNLLTEENLPMLHDVAALGTVADLHQDDLHDDDGGTEL